MPPGAYGVDMVPLIGVVNQERIEPHYPVEFITQNEKVILWPEYLGERV